jgi:hypothetical protein
MNKTIKATIPAPDTIITEITIKGLRKELCGTFKIELPRKLTTISTTGTIIHVELCDDREQLK